MRAEKELFLEETYRQLYPPVRDITQAEFDEITVTAFQYTG